MRATSFLGSKKTLSKSLQLESIHVHLYVNGLGMLATSGHRYKSGVCRFEARLRYR